MPVGPLTEREVEGEGKGVDEKEESVQSGESVMLFKKAAAKCDIDYCNRSAILTQAWLQVDIGDLRRNGPRKTDNGSLA